eukprot:TRINITY_DN6447_c0_g1_i2.p1 TRINITY_DN6447_c0_g1~~TRINITY_DN6447_c0_g1_i2.p1  ORF type:complete len:190 (+),score=57.31 TRINITY_DN6447_c0_g1_i2:3-572(+)
MMRMMMMMMMSGALRAGPRLPPVGARPRTITQPTVEFPTTTNSNNTTAQFNRGFNVDRKSFFSANKQMRMQARNERNRYYNNHIGWGPMPHYKFVDVTDMARELERRESNPHDLSPSPCHKNKPMIVPKDFDFVEAKARRGKYQPKANTYYDPFQHALRHDKAEYKRLRGDPIDNHLKYYHGHFELHSL